jgi:hypothetical protein
MHVLISYLSTNYLALQEHWRKYSILKNRGKKGSDRPFTGELGGMIELIHWESKSVVWQMEVESPAGLVYDKSTGLLYVNSIRLGRILVISMSDKKIIDTIDNPYFNKPHSLVKTKNGFMVSSTGIDAIVEVNMKGDTLYSLFLTDCGYLFDQVGKKRVIDKEVNHQGVEYPSLHQTTHVNYARYLDNSETQIVATLFHTGELVVFEKETHTLTVRLEGLKNPHNFKPAGEQYLLCNTCGNTIFVFEKDFSITRVLQFDGCVHWIQDAIWIFQTDTILVSDADNHKIVEVNSSNNVIDEYQFSTHNRIYDMYQLGGIT